MLLPPARKIALRIFSTFLALILIQSFSGNLPSACTMANSISNSKPKPAERLSPTIRPDHYDLTFAPDLAGGTFKGSARILISLAQPAQEIVLNSVELEISDPTLQSVNGDNTALPLTTSLDPEHECVHLTLAGPVSAGQFILSLKFAGKLNKQLRGFYGATSETAGSNRIIMAITQLEPTDARRMFPCFDEPAFKASFTISAVIEENLKAISNGPIASETVQAGKRTVVFRETPKMSTYLVALLIGPFKSTPPVEACGVQIRVWSVNQNVALGAKAEEFAAQLLAYYTSYFGVPYPESKLDLVAIPDFEAGAMENLGAITFREPGLLFNPKKDSIRSEIGMASVIAHEMAHMWFGDLVTMSWWDDIWLNEAFATWMSHKALEHIRPTWRTWDSWAEAKNESMETDGLAASRAIHADVANPTEAFEMFDDISYSKGASIIRMLEKYVGDLAFRRGVQIYIKRFSFRNASTEDLWKAVAEASGKAIPQLMHAWVYQPGFPILTVLTKDNSSTITQSRFFNIQSKSRATGSGADWVVPIGCLSGLKPNSVTAHPSQYLLMHDQKLDLQSGTLVEPYFCNAFGAGYYRVAYSRSNLSKLARIQQLALNPLERYTLLSDQYALTFKGDLPPNQFLPFLLSYKDERDPFVIVAVCHELHELFDLLDKSSEPLFARYVRDILLPIKKQLTWQAAPNESEPTKLARSTVLVTLANYGSDHQTIAEARHFFAKYLSNSDSVSPNLVSAIETIVAHNGNEQDYQKLKSVWKNGPTPSARNRALMSLSLFRAPAIVDRTLALTTSDELKLQDSPNLLSSTLSQKDNNERAWKFLTGHWQNISTRYPPFMIGRLVGGETGVRTQSGANEFRSFFELHRVPEAERDIARTSERIQNNISFLAHAQEDILVWLQKHYSKQTPVEK
jgi:puromycin-sensitive aminopeptidase